MSTAVHYVFALDSKGRPVLPVLAADARQLLNNGEATVVRRFPFVIKLKVSRAKSSAGVYLKIDPGSLFTGLALVIGTWRARVVWLACLEHKGNTVRQRMEKRSNYRRRRRSANLRYRKPRFSYRTRALGWLAPSLETRVSTILSWAKRLSCWVPLEGIMVERARFDMQKMQNPEIAGIEYQYGTLHGYESKEYVLYRGGYECVYCGGRATEADHVIPRASGGSDRLSNLVASCRPCNQKKDSTPVEVFLKKKPEVLRRVKAQLKKPLKDAAAVNATNNELLRRLALEFPNIAVTWSYGYVTKYNRNRLSIPKTHALDAALVGDVESITNWSLPTLNIKCQGRGSYQRGMCDATGFPRLTKDGKSQVKMKTKFSRGFQTGDLVMASNKKVGSIFGRIVVRAKGNFDLISVGGSKPVSVSPSNCKLVQRSDGYSYTWTQYQDQAKDSATNVACDDVTKAQ